MKYLRLISALCVCQSDFIMVQSPELGCRVVVCLFETRPPVSQADLQLYG